MGADGGVKLKRSELVKDAKTLSEEDQHSAAEYNKHGRWQTCSLSQRPLSKPVVSDYKGQLYNKESILELLVEPESLSGKQRELVSHITSLKDVVELRLTEDDGHFVCPITGHPLGSNRMRYVYLVKCRCVFSEKCLRDTSTKDTHGLLCPLCSEPYATEDVIVINPEADDINKLQRRMDSLMGKSLPHSLLSKKKKSDKKKKRKHEDEQNGETKKQHS